MERERERKSFILNKQQSYYFCQFTEMWRYICYIMLCWAWSSDYAYIDKTNILWCKCTVHYLYGARAYITTNCQTIDDNILAYSQLLIHVFSVYNLSLQYLSKRKR